MGTVLLIDDDIDFFCLRLRYHPEIKWLHAMNCLNGSHLFQSYQSITKKKIDLCLIDYMGTAFNTLPIEESKSITCPKIFISSAIIPQENEVAFLSKDSIDEYLTEFKNKSPE